MRQNFTRDEVLAIFHGRVKSRLAAFKTTREHAEALDVPREHNYNNTVHDLVDLGFFAAKFDIGEATFEALIQAAAKAADVRLPLTAEP